MMNGTIGERFWSKVKKSPDCWIWTKGLQNGGYGQFYFKHKNFLAHRISWTLSNGEIPEGLCVLHKCDVRNCVNPDHLFLGTYLDNALDRDKKGRQGDHKFEKNGQAKLTEEKVEEIRKLYHEENVSLKVLGKKFNVSFQQISRIVRFESWSPKPTIQHINFSKGTKL